MMINNKKNNKNNASNGSNNNNHIVNKFTKGNDTNVNKKNNANNKFTSSHKNEKPIKTSKEMLTMLIDFKKNKGLKKPNKEMQGVFQENIYSLIKEKGFSSETVKFIIDGYMFNSVDAVEKYFASSQSAKYEMQALIKYIKADALNAQIGFKILVAFMGKYCDYNKPVAKLLMPEIIKAINVMAFSREDKNKLNKGNVVTPKS